MRITEAWWPTDIGELGFSERPCLRGIRWGVIEKDAWCLHEHTPLHICETHTRIQTQKQKRKNYCYTGVSKGKEEGDKILISKFTRVSLCVKGGKRCMFEGNRCMFHLKSEEEMNEWGIKTYFHRFKKEKPGWGCFIPEAQKLTEATAVFWALLLLLFPSNLWFCGSLHCSYNHHP